MCNKKYFIILNIIYYILNIAILTMSSNITNLASLVIVGPLITGIKQLLNTGKSKFVNIPDLGLYSKLVIVIFLVLIILVILVILIMPYAIYLLTGSLVQAILCFMLQGIYIALAILFYAFSGHKFCIKS